MSNLAVFGSDTQNIETILIGDKIWLNGSQVAKALGYSNTSKAIRHHVPSGEKQEIPMKRRGSSPFFISEDGLRHLVINSKLPKSAQIASKMGLCIIRAKRSIAKPTKGIIKPTKGVMKLTKEQETIGIIIEAFKHLNPIREFSVNGYRIDLYFPCQRLAIECDENGHTHYDQVKENSRQSTIELALGCRFIRYNPDCPGFNIGTVINQIVISLTIN